jgi:ATP-binding cassette, subfamily B, bacterial MsbA
MTLRLTPHQRRMLGYLRRYLFPYIALLAVAMLMLSATNGSIPFIAKSIIDQLSKTGDVARIRELSFAILGIIVLRAAASFGRDYLSAYAAQKIVVDLRSELNDKLQRMSLSFFNRTPTGVMVSRVINDVQVLAQGTTGVFNIFGDGTSLLALIGAALYLDWKLALIALVVFPLSVGPIARISRKMRQMTKSAQKQLSGLNVLLQETFQGNRVVKAFGMEDYERRRFNAEARRLFRIYMRVARTKAFTSPMIEVMAAVAIVAVLWYGTTSVISGTRTAGEFGAFFLAMLLVYEPFKRLSGTNNTIQQALGAAERVFDMMDESTEVPDDPNALELAPGPHSIAFENVSFRYGREWVLRDIKLAIPAGKVVALVGMSGGGKSTLADLIPRFYDVQQGRLAVDGIDVRRIKLASLRSQIGLVTQSTFLFNDTVRANIAYGSNDRNFERIVQAATLANAHDFIMRLPQQYDTVVGELGVRLSGGERQRIAIARALLKDAPILILDEATSSLDSEAERSVQEALEHLMQNRTTLVIAHRLSTVRRADRIVVIVHGRIVEKGTHDELFARGQEYRKLYDLQFMSPEELAQSGPLVN